MDFKRGIEMTANEFRTLLKALNVEEIDPLGEPFDPLLHEALSSEESTKVKPGHVLKVFKKAYRLHDKLIRPAQVVVATETTSENSEDSPTEE